MLARRAEAQKHLEALHPIYVLRKAGSQLRAAPLSNATEDEPPPIDEAAAILELHEGNALEAIQTLPAERDAVEEKRRFASIAMGHGFTRGWRTRLPDKFIGEG